MEYLWSKKKRTKLTTFTGSSSVHSKATPNSSKTLWFINYAKHNCFALLKIKRMNQRKIPKRSWHFNVVFSIYFKASVSCCDEPVVPGALATMACEETQSRYDLVMTVKFKLFWLSCQHLHKTTRHPRYRFFLASG